MDSPEGRGRLQPARVSYVVLSYNSAQVLERCVRSLARQADAAERDELWIVDNGSVDGSRELAQRLQAEFSGLVNVILLERNFGTTVSRNIALRKVSGRYVAIVDSDVDVPSGAVRALIDHLNAVDGAGLIAPRLQYPDGRLQLSVDQFPTLSHKIRRYLSLRSMEQAFNTGERSGDPLQKVEYAISALWLMKREVLDAVGFLDERIFYAPEDVDYCVRVWKAGYSIVYDTSISAIHDAQEISRRPPWQRMARSHIAGLVYLFHKHGYLLTRRRLYRDIARALGRDGDLCPCR